MAERRVLYQDTDFVHYLNGDMEYKILNQRLKVTNSVIEFLDEERNVLDSHSKQRDDQEDASEQSLLGIGIAKDIPYNQMPQRGTERRDSYTSTSQIARTAVLISDGDVSHRPTQRSIKLATAITTENFIDRLRILWVEAGHDESQTVALPNRYALYKEKRAGSGRTDLYLYGHPGGQRFRSPKEFLPHFEYLVRCSNGRKVSCDCKYC